MRQTVGAAAWACACRSGRCESARCTRHVGKAGAEAGPLPHPRQKQNGAHGQTCWFAHGLRRCTHWPLDISTTYSVLHRRQKIGSCSAEVSKSRRSRFTLAPSSRHFGQRTKSCLVGNILPQVGKVCKPFFNLSYLFSLNIHCFKPENAETLFFFLSRGNFRQIFDVREAPELRHALLAL